MFKKFSAMSQKNPLVFMAIVFIIFALIVVVISVLLPKPDKYVGIDPASREEVSREKTGGLEVEEINLLGFSKLLDPETQLSLNDVSNLKTILSQFADEELPNVKRISLEINSINVDGQNISFNIVVNVDENRFRVGLEKSTNKLDVSVYNLKGELIYQHKNVASNILMIGQVYVFKNPNTILFRTQNLANNYSRELIEAIGVAIVLYARTTDLDLERIAAVNDSLKEITENDSALSSSFSAVLNVNEAKLLVNIDSVTRDVISYIKIYNEKDELAFEATLDPTNKLVSVGGNLPAGRTSLSSGDTTITNEYIPEFDKNTLPPLKVGDKVNMYYSCPAENSSSKDVCQVYKYDFYF
jgi:hypothetical protein